MDISMAMLNMRAMIFMGNGKLCVLLNENTHYSRVVVVYAFNPHTWEAETGGSLSTEIQPGLKNSQGYIEKHCLKNKTKENKKTIPLYYQVWEHIPLLPAWVGVGRRPISVSSRPAWSTLRAPTSQSYLVRPKIQKESDAMSKHKKHHKSSMAASSRTRGL